MVGSRSPCGVCRMVARCRVKRRCEWFAIQYARGVLHDLRRDSNRHNNSSGKPRWHERCPSHPDVHWTCSGIGRFLVWSRCSCVAGVGATDSTALHRRNRDHPGGNARKFGHGFVSSSVRDDDVPLGCLAWCRIADVGCRGALHLLLPRGSANRSISGAAVRYGLAWNLAGQRHFFELVRVGHGLEIVRRRLVLGRPEGGCQCRGWCRTR
mmetsp:Transcript_10401/g.26013  ORF Transcript_10401/g.26013 Transcript_10401/m.26013 type:complete len:210 (+) Transcript_10401:687-1316(+)